MSEIKIDEIQVGEYIRTTQGYIAKITDIDNNFIHADDTIYCGYEESSLMFIEEKMLDGRTFRAEDYILKNSPNIIDLIEVGDFVKIEYFSNRYSKRVERIFEVDCIIDKSICFENGHYTLNILSGEWSNQDKKLKPIIKSIVTKEHFERLEYKL